MRRQHALVALAVSAAALLAACGATTTPHRRPPHRRRPCSTMEWTTKWVRPTAPPPCWRRPGYQDVATAEAAGYASSLDTLGCSPTPSSAGWACTTSTTT